MLGLDEPPSRRNRFSSKCLLITIAISLIAGLAITSQFTTTENDFLSSSLAKAQSLLPLSPSCKPSTSSKPDSLKEIPRINFLHFIDFETYDSVMDRWFARSQAEFASSQHLIADAPVWGKGFPGYDDSKTLIENVVAKYGRPDYFDAVLPYYNGDQINWLGIDPVPMFWEVRDLSRVGTVVIDRPHEMRDSRRVPIIDHANVTIVLCPYASECYEYKQDYERSVLLVHQPHPVESRLFEHPLRAAKGKTVKRERDVILAGSLEAPMYPLRHRLSQMIEDGKIPGYIRPHPGYPDIMPAEEREANGINVAFLEKQLRDFSNDLGSSKVCFVTSSRWGYSVQKYGEAAAAGCLIIGNIPFDREDDFAEFVVTISNKDSDDKIIRTVKYWLDPKNEAERIARAEKGQRYFLSKFSGQRYVEDVVTWIRLAKRGQRGMLLPYQWEIPPDPLPMDG